MKGDRAEILRVVQHANGIDIDGRVLEVLSAGEARRVGGHQRGGTVRATIDLWRARAETAQERGLQLVGVNTLLAQLEERGPRSKVEQISFQSKYYICNLFFEWNSDHVLGYVLSRRRAHRTSDREAALTGLNEIDASSPPAAAEA